MKKKNLLSLGLGLLIGTLLILLWFQIVDFDELILRFKEVALTPIIISLLIYLLAYFIRSWRWYLLMKPNEGLGLWRVWSISLSGNFINYLIPIRLGELVKAWLVKKHSGTPIAKNLPLIFIDKSFDTIGIFLALALVPFLKIKFTGPVLILMALLLLFFALSLIILLFSVKYKDKAVRLLQFLFSWLPPRIRTGLNRQIGLFIEGLNIFEHQPLRLLWALMLTILGVMLDGLYFWLVFIAFGISYPFVMVLFGYTLINLSYALPQPPAQLGSNEWMMIIIFSAGFGLTKADASAVMAFAHILTALVILTAGITSLSISGGQILSKIFKGENLYE